MGVLERERQPVEGAGRHAAGGQLVSLARRRMRALDVEAHDRGDALVGGLDPVEVQLEELTSRDLPGRDGPQNRPRVAVVVDRRRRQARRRDSQPPTIAPRRAASAPTATPRGKPSASEAAGATYTPRAAPPASVAAASVRTAVVATARVPPVSTVLT